MLITLIIFITKTDIIDNYKLMVFITKNILQIQLNPFKHSN